ncbi:hypothetical protein CN905_15655 [Bacillus wiedmannii]|nr:hypothetical protein CN905_15655 [Bacillus wiedmannii]
MNCADYLNLQNHFLFTFLIHLRNIHVLSSIRSILFILSCEIYQTEKPYPPKPRASPFKYGFYALLLFS